MEHLLYAKLRPECQYVTLADNTDMNTARLIMNWKDGRVASPTRSPIWLSPFCNTEKVQVIVNGVSLKFFIIYLRGRLMASSHLLTHSTNIYHSSSWAKSWAGAKAWSQKLNPGVLSGWQGANASNSQGIH